MSAVAKGNSFELLVATHLEEQGWLVGMRRHRRGGGDLIATHPRHRTRLVECKATASPWVHFRRTDRQELLEAAERAGADALLALRKPGGKIAWFPSDTWP